MATLTVKVTPDGLEAVEHLAEQLPVRMPIG